MGLMDRTERLEAAKQVARMAGAMLQDGQRGNLEITSKGKNDFVTVMDVQSEQLIIDYLHERFPEDNVLGEEIGFKKHGNGGTWIIDPVDGTTNYIHGLPGYSVSIAYEESPWHPIIGVVYDPTNDELYAAQEGVGVWCNDQPIAVSSVADRHDSVIMISPPLRKRELLDDYMHLFNTICADSGETRDYGSAALHMCYVAHGRGEAFIEFGLGYHDIAAGTAILKEAGGAISTLDMRQKSEFTSSLIATNAVLHEWFVSQVQIR